MTRIAINKNALGLVTPSGVPPHPPHPLPLPCRGEGGDEGALGQILSQIDGFVSINPGPFSLEGRQQLTSHTWMRQIGWHFLPSVEETGHRQKESL